MTPSKKRIREEYNKSGIQKTVENIIEEKTWIVMPDAVRLRAIVIRPLDAGPFPAILQRTCYPEYEEENYLNGRELAARGYAYVCVYCRGCGESEGNWIPNENERADGIDNVNWLSNQTWVDKIGFWGSSYGALTGWAIADAVADKVSAMCLSHYGTDRHFSLYCKGAFRHDVMTAWAMRNAGFQIDADYLESCRFLPQLEVDEELWGGRLDWYREWISNPEKDASCWNEGFWKLLRDMPGKTQIPLCITESWYDHHFGSAMHTHEDLNPIAKQHSWLRIGCWNHAYFSCMEDMELPGLNPGDINSMLQFFELTLRQGKLPVNKVEIYKLGVNDWIQLPRWPVTELKTETWMLGENGILTEDTVQLGRISYKYDPENPVPTHGAESVLNTMEEAGSKLQPEPNWRSDVISFVSKPMSSSRNIVGKVQVLLEISSDCPDTAFTAKLMEVSKEGIARNIRSTIATIGADYGVYKPGDVITINLEFWDIAWEVKNGCRLRIDISSSDFPQYNIHSNYAGLWAKQTKTQVAKQTIYLGGIKGSRLTLPLST